MDILESLEMRWFLSEGDPMVAIVRDWFGQTKLEEGRCDEYLLTDRDDIGCKARVVQGQPIKIETKYLIGSLGAIQIAPRISGRLERWRKLSVALDDAKLKQSGTWRSIEKERQLRKLAFQRGNAFEVDVKARPDDGCGVELTRLRYQSGGGERIAWTFGLEAFGAEDQLLEIFQAACRTTFGAGLALELERSCSMSYPEWLGAAHQGRY